MPADLLMHWDKSVRAMCGTSASVWSVLKTGAECLWESLNKTALTNWFGSLLKLMYAPTFDQLMLLLFSSVRSLWAALFRLQTHVALGSTLVILYLNWNLVPELEIHVNVK